MDACAGGTEALRITQHQRRNGELQVSPSQVVFGGWGVAVDGVGRDQGQTGTKIGHTCNKHPPIPSTYWHPLVIVVFYDTWMPVLAGLMHCTSLKISRAAVRGVVCS